MTATVVIEKFLDLPADAVWRAIEGIGGLDRWFPIIEACEVEGQVVGALRVLTLQGGGEMRDRIIEVSKEAKRLSYHRTHLPFPVSDYYGEVRIFEAEPLRSRLTWTVRFEVAPAQRDAMLTLVRSAISDGVDGLERELRSGAPSPTR
jgi:uncharacterized protein YndB with AHSA1/START domain